MTALLTCQPRRRRIGTPPLILTLEHRSDIELWQQVLALTLTPALAIGATAWIIRKLLEQGLQRDIEKFKSQLELERFEHQTRFSFIHQKRAEIVSGLYSRLARTKARLGDLVAIFQPGGQTLPDKKRVVAEAYNDASSFFFENRIFFTESTALKVEEVLDAMRGAFYAFDTAQRGNEDYKPDTSGLWMESYKNVKEKLPPLLSELEGQFRETLGIIEGEP